MLPHILGKRRRRDDEPDEEPSSPPCQEEEHVAEPASAQTPLGPDVLHPNGYQEEQEHVPEPSSAQTLQDASSITATCSSYPQEGAVAQGTIDILPPSASTPGSRIWQRRYYDWGFSFIIRADSQGCFHTYPDTGGPFQSLLEAVKAIDRYFDDRRDPKMCMEQDGVFSMERTIRQCLYWPDGSIKKLTKSYVTKRSHDLRCRFAQALVDKYNDDHNRSGDLAYELKNVLDCITICENRIRYYHLNFTAKTKAADLDSGVDDIFFVEVKITRQGKYEELLVSCFCMINPTANGQHCYGCTNNGSVGMKHPDSSVGYTAGHLDVRLKLGCYKEWSDSDEDDDEYVRAKEAKLRYIYQGLDDPRVMEKLLTLPPGVTRGGKGPRS